MSPAKQGLRRAPTGGAPRDQLPFVWRELKQVQRRRMAALGMSDDVVYPVERESFAEVVEHALTVHAPKLFDHMLAQGSPLFEASVVDPDELRCAVGRLITGNYSEDWDAKLLQVLSLHMSAEAFLR